MPNSINMRKALAGAALLNEASKSEAMRQAGYAETTARNSSKLSPKVAIDQAIAAGLAPDIATIRDLGRTAFARKLQEVYDDPKSFRLGEISRAVDVIERYWGDTQDPSDIAPRAFVARMEWIVGVQQELERRKQAALPAAAVTVDDGEQATAVDED